MGSIAMAISAGVKLKKTNRTEKKKPDPAKEQNDAIAAMAARMAAKRAKKPQTWRHSVRVSMENLNDGSEEGNMLEALQKANLEGAPE